MSNDTQRRDKQNKEYLNREVNMILEPLMLEVVKQRPENQVNFLNKINEYDQIKFMLKYMEENFGERATIGDRQFYNYVKEESKKLDEFAV